MVISIERVRARATTCDMAKKFTKIEYFFSSSSSIFSAPLVYVEHNSEYIETNFDQAFVSKVELRKLTVSASSTQT